MSQQTYTWKDKAKDSSWITDAWDWFMNLLGRAAEGVLWVTMVFSCYQLIPGAPQPPTGISDFVFICQFIALDIGGAGLNKIAQGQGLKQSSYPRVIAYILIAITLVTVGYAGLQHAVKIPSNWTTFVEVCLVVFRSIMTVLYGQAIYNLKHKDKSLRSIIDELRASVDRYEQEKKSTVDRYEQEKKSMVDQNKKSIAQVTRELQEEITRCEGEKQVLIARNAQELAGVQEELKATQEKLAKAMAYKRSLRTQGTRSIAQDEKSTVDQKTESTIDQKTRSMVHVPQDEKSTVDQKTRSISIVEKSTVDQSVQSVDHRARIKQGMLDHPEMDYKTLAQSLQVGLSTVKKWAPAIKKEITQGEQEITRNTGELLAQEIAQEIAQGEGEKNTGEYEIVSIAS